MAPRSVLSLTTLATLSCLAQAQDFIHYKFDSTCTNEVINYATGPQALASNGTLESNSAASPWTSGLFGGGALAGGANATPTFYNRVVSGWNPATQPVTGSVTMAWFMREARSPGTALSYLLGAPTGGFRLFTNGVAGRGLYQRNIMLSGGNPGIDFVLPAATTDVQTLAAAGWVHIAIVIDGAATTADWYVNGTSVLQLTGVGGANIVNAGPFMIGAYTTAATGAGNAYDMDEFVLSLRAYTPAEIMALALAPHAGDGDYRSATTTQCGSLGLGSTGGRPTLGNPGYGFQVNATGPSFIALLLGYDRCVYGGVLPLPADAGALNPIAAGCMLLTDVVGSASTVTVTGTATLAFPIPGNPIFMGSTLYSQAVGIDLGTQAVSASNGFTFSVGN